MAAAKKTAHQKVTAKQAIRHALSLPSTVEENPFGPEVDVYKVEGKVFAIVDSNKTPPTVTLKCDPELALHLRGQYSAVIPGYHLNKKHWNTVALDGTMPPDEVLELIEHSYEQVVAGLPKSVRERLGEE